MTATMEAIAVIPARHELARLTVPAPALAAPDEVLVRTLEVGVCGTDREICALEYGTPPPGDEHLVLGHEALGEVLAVGSAVRGLRPGDLVVPSVRRPCDDPRCAPCRAERQDFCQSGGFRERGILGLHGFMSERFVERASYLYRLSPELRELGVLVEPLTVAEKGLAQAWQAQGRLPWATTGPDDPAAGRGKRALVLGAGPVGLLGAMMLRVRGFETVVQARTPGPHDKAAVVQAIGATYADGRRDAVQLARELGPFDLIYEACGAGPATLAAVAELALNGVAILTGIPAEGFTAPVAADSLLRRISLGNLALVGTVNADGPAFAAALRDLARFSDRWPEAVGRLVRRHALDEHRALLLEPPVAIKSVLSFTWRFDGGDGGG